ncbi:hypothetical protein BD0036_13200 [Helicobacter pylori]
MIFSTLINAIAVILSSLITIYMWVVIIYSLIGFVQLTPITPSCKSSLACVSRYFIFYALDSSLCLTGWISLL